MVKTISNILASWIPRVKTLGYSVMGLGNLLFNRTHPYAKKSVHS